MSARRALAAALLAAAALALPATGAAHGGPGPSGREDGEDRDDRGAVTVPAPPPPAPAPAAPAVAAAPEPAAAPAADVAATAPDAAAPALSRVRATLLRGRRSGRLRLTVSEDARLDVAMRSLGRAHDLVATRRLTLYARAGTSSVRLPAMNLSGRRYRLLIVAVDQAGNRSPALAVVARTRRP